MGASIGMARGAADAGLQPAIAVIGDSTFLHSGLTPLMDAVAHGSSITVIILDNETVGMTGQQPTLLPGSRLEPIVLGLGITPEHLRIIEITKRRIPELAAAIRDEMGHSGPSVIIAVKECVEARKDRHQGAES